MIWFFRAVGKYAVFNGRARRKEFWYFTLFSFLLAIALGIILGLLGVDPNGREFNYTFYAYDLAFLLPNIGVGVRRMHDIGRSGWYILVPVYNLILFCENGMVGDNEYGPDPKRNKEYGAGDYERHFDINPG